MARRVQKIMLSLCLGWVFPRSTPTDTVLQTADNVLCPFGCSKPENEIHVLNESRKYMLLRFRYLPDSLNVNDHQKYFMCIMNDELKENSLNIAKYLFSAFKLRLSSMNIDVLP